MNWSLITGPGREKMVVPQKGSATCLIKAYKPDSLKKLITLLFDISITNIVSPEIYEIRKM
jgi:hypothetical protein